MKVTTCIIAAAILTSCTAVRYSDGTRSLTVVDIHPGGETLVLDGALTSIGKVSINRNTEDSSTVIGAAVDAVVGL